MPAPELARLLRMKDALSVPAPPAAMAKAPPTAEHANNQIRRKVCSLAWKVQRTTNSSRVCSKVSELRSKRAVGPDVRAAACEHKRWHKHMWLCTWANSASAPCRVAVLFAMVERASVTDPAAHQTVRHTHVQTRSRA